MCVLVSEVFRPALQRDSRDTGVMNGKRTALRGDKSNE
jgi:hypothetical protein